MPRLTMLLIFAALLLSYSAGEVIAKDEETPPWMEDVIAGDRKVYLIPKGAKKEVFGSQVTVEPTEEYVARRIYEFEQFMEQRFKTMDEKYAGLLAEMEALKSAVEQLKQEMVRTPAETDSAEDTAGGVGAAAK